MYTNEKICCLLTLAKTIYFFCPIMVIHQTPTLLSYIAAIYVFVSLVLLLLFWRKKIQ